MSERCMRTVGAATRLSYLATDAVSLALVARRDGVTRARKLRSVIDQMEILLVDMRLALAAAEAEMPAKLEAAE